MTESLFEARKRALKMQVLLESYHSLDYHVPNGKGGTLQEDADKAFATMLAEDKIIDTSVGITKARNTNEKSAVFQLLHEMPKGALLHTHGIATGPFDALVDILRKDPRMYVYTGNTSKGEVDHHFRYLTNKEAEKATKNKEYTSAGSFSHEELMDIVVLPADTPRSNLWPVFQHVWMRLDELSNSIPLWKGEGSYFWSILTHLLNTGVTYVEIKQLIPEGWVVPSEDGETVDRSVGITVFMDVFKETVDLFVKQNPRFSGARVIWCALKVMEKDIVEHNANLVLELMKLYPNYVAGFDLVGHEDTLKPVSMYADILGKFREKGGRLLLHAGETLEPDADQIYDAVSLGCARIGHAYSLSKFPALMRIVRDRGITIECCPLSNQGLGYVQDMRNHPGLIMINNGIRVTISSDDAAIFGYDDVTHDFAIVAKAWGLTLGQLKHLARQSFKSTALSHDDQLAAEAQFDIDWDNFLEDFVGRSKKKASCVGRRSKKH